MEKRMSINKIIIIIVLIITNSSIARIPKISWNEDVFELFTRIGSDKKEIDNRGICITKI